MKFGGVVPFNEKIGEAKYFIKNKNGGGSYFSKKRDTFRVWILVADYSLFDTCIKFWGRGKFAIFQMGVV